MYDTRPKNLNLFTIQFPIPAIVSILHRFSGIFLFLLVPFMLSALSLSLTDSGFDMLKYWISHFSVRLVFWLLLIPFCYHLVAGVRHLFADIHVGDSLKSGRFTALLTFIISAILLVLAGIWLW